MQRDDRLSGVGPEGLLVQKFQRREDRTVLADSYCRIPLQSFHPFQEEGSGCAYTYLINPTGGLAGGDRIRIEISLEENAHVFVTAPSAQKIYRSLGEFSSQEMNFSLKSGAVLEYFPPAVIPFAGSLFRQKARITMEEKAVALLLDFMTTGRVARGEHLLFSEYRSTWEVIVGGELVLCDRAVLQPAREDYGALGLWEGNCALATLYFIFHDPSAAEGLVENLRGAINHGRGLTGGVSTLPSHGIAVRMLAPTARLLEKSVRALWLLARKRILPDSALSSFSRFVPF